MTATHPTRSAVVPAPRPPLAGPLELRPLRWLLRAPQPGRRQGLVDGAWWPYSDDLVTELAPLLAELAARGHLVQRISYGLDAWPPVPRQARLAGTLVRLGGYRTQPPDTVHLSIASGSEPLVLVVVPPTTTPYTAERALHLSATSTTLDAGGVLEAASRRSPMPAAARVVLLS